MREPERTSRFTKEDWLRLGARRLCEEGAAALTIERLTAARRATRGSFHDHSANRDAFVREMMERRRAETIVCWGARYEEAKSPKELRRLMRKQPLEFDHVFERAERRWAASEPIVRAALDEVDAKRIEDLSYLIGYLRPELSDPTAAAFLQYTTLIGLQFLFERLDDPRLPAIMAYGDRLFGLEHEAPKAEKESTQSSA